MSKKRLGIVLFVATPLKGRFIVFSQQLLIGYFRLGDCFAALGNWHRMARATDRGEKQGESYFGNTTTRPYKRRCYERDYTPKLYFSMFQKMNFGSSSKMRFCLRCLSIKLIKMSVFIVYLNINILQLLFFRAESPGRYYELNIHYGLFVGGMGDFNKVFLGNQKNFRGCMEVNLIYFFFYSVFYALKTMIEFLSCKKNLKIRKALIKVNTNLLYLFVKGQTIQINYILFFFIGCNVQWH